MGGWATLRAGLEFTRGHDWSEFSQLRIHMGRREPVPSPAITRVYLESVLGFLPMFLNQYAAAGQRFSTVMAFKDPGVGAFTLEVADGGATIKAGESPDANLVMAQSSSPFEKTIHGIQTMPDALQSGAIEVSNLDSLVTFGELFPISI